MPLQLTYLEEVETLSPSVIGASPRDGKTTRTWQIEDVGEDDLETAIKEILGWTDPAVSQNGAMARNLPLADPQFEYWYANSIEGIHGKGQSTLTDTELDNPPSRVPTFPGYALYPDYWISVVCGKRDYDILPDADIDINEGSYWPSTYTGVSQTYIWANEWKRFCEPTFVPKEDYLTQKNAKMQFLTDGTNDLSYKPFAGGVRMYIPNQVLTINCYGVPIRYTQSVNSYITSFRGRVNQSEFTTCAGVHPPGSLLYLTYVAKPFTPPIADFGSVYPGVYSPQKMCDLSLVFLQTSRVCNDAPSVTNPNYVTGGHNALPCMIDRKFHYAASAPKTGEGVPSFLSAPLEMLLTDPDTTQPGFSGIGGE